MRNTVTFFFTIKLREETTEQFNSASVSLVCKLHLIKLISIITETKFTGNKNCVCLIHCEVTADNFILKQHEAEQNQFIL